METQVPIRSWDEDTYAHVFVHNLKPKNWMEYEYRKMYLLTKM